MDSSNSDLRHDLAVRMAELARAMAVPRTLEQILDDVTAAAVQLVPGADAAGVLLVKRGGDFESLGDTDGFVKTNTSVENFWLGAAGSNRTCCS